MGESPIPYPIKNAGVVGIGRHRGLKILRWKHHTGSSPVASTIWERPETVIYVYRTADTHSNFIKRSLENFNLRFNSAAPIKAVIFTSWLIMLM